MTQTVPDISPLMPMHQDPLLVCFRYPSKTLYRLMLQITHWGRVTHICVGNLTIIGSDNALSPDRRQAIIWSSAGILLIRPLGTNFSEILIGIQTFSFTKMHSKMSSGKWRPFCPGLNVITWSHKKESRLRAWNITVQNTMYKKVSYE